MSEHCKLSIITVSFNAEAFIEQCIKSVIEQECSEVEHIIVDGNSSDSTLAIIKSYAARYPHIRYISEPDEGQSDAMNKGVAMASGEYLAFLNSDDFYEANVLTEAIQLLDTHPEISFLYGNIIVRDLDGEILWTTVPKNFSLLLYLTLPNGELDWPINPAAYFIRRSLMEKVGHFDTALNQTMDVAFLLRVMYHAKSMYVPRFWGNFVIHAHCKTNQSFEAGTIQLETRETIEAFCSELPAAAQLKIRLLRSFFSVFFFARRCLFFIARRLLRLLELRHG